MSFWVSFCSAETNNNNTMEQQPGDAALTSIVRRLERLEKENVALKKDMDALKQENLLQKFNMLALTSERDQAVRERDEVLRYACNMLWIARTRYVSRFGSCAAQHKHMMSR